MGCKIKYLLFVALAVLAVSCKKETVGTTSGNITLNITALHHSWPVHYLRVYLKYDTTSWPGTVTGLYDDSTETSQNGNCSFGNLYTGNYYIYATGYDPAVDTTVIGYMPVAITKDNITDHALSVTMYVSETH